MTAEQERTFLQMLQLGSYQAEAARKIGVSRSTITMRMARRPEFRAAVEAAEAGHEFGVIVGIRKAGEKDWRALAWIAERKYPERWGRPEIRAQLGAGNIDPEELKKAFHAGLSTLARMWAPPGAPDEDGDGAPAETSAPTEPPRTGVTRS